MKRTKQKIHPTGSVGAILFLLCAAFAVAPHSRGDAAGGSASAVKSPNGSTALSVDRPSLRGQPDLETLSLGNRPVNAASPAAPLKEPTRFVRVFIFGSDIYPDVIRTTAGSVRIVAENQTQSDVVLVVNRHDTGQPALNTANVGTSLQAKRASQTVALTPGEYEFYERTRPDVKGKILVK